MYALCEPAPRLSQSFRIRILLLILILLALGTLSFGAEPGAAQRGRLAEIRVPFVENCGQWDERVAFAAKANFGTVFVTHTGQLVYSLGSGASDGWTLTETAISGKSAPRAGQAAVTRVSYFHGSDPSRWQSGLPSYQEINLGQVWRGVSISLRAHGGYVEKLFTVEPGAKAGRIRLRLTGTKSLRIDRAGSLIAETGFGEVRFTAPEAYQEHSGTRQPVSVAYVHDRSSYGFRLGDHDPSLPVVIDPLLRSTYLGGSGSDHVSSMAIHTLSGEVLVAGSTASFDFPGTAGGAQPGKGDYDDSFVARLDPTLATLLQATYLGGGGIDGAQAIAVDPSTGDILVAGYTGSTDFPGAANGAQPSYAGGGDGFAVRLDPSLTVLLQATYLGGGNGDAVWAVGIDPSTGDLLVAGNTSSTDFPGTAGGAQAAFGGSSDIFVARLNPALTTLLQATYVGGSSLDGFVGIALAVDPSTREVFVAGDTFSSDFPGTAGGAQPAFGGFVDGFVARLTPDLTSLLQATYLGGISDDHVFAIAVDPSTGDILVAGYTDGSDFPGTAGGAQSTPGYPSNAFVARLDTTLTALLQATYLGGSGNDVINAIAVHPSTGDVFVAGYTQSPDLPGAAGGAQPAFNGPDAGFAARLNPALTTLFQATYLGGSDFDGVDAIATDAATGDVLVGGNTSSTEFPATAGGAQPIFGGDIDGFVARLTPDLAALLVPVGLTVDPQPNPGDGDFIFEPGEEVPLIPLWTNQSSDPYSPNGQASDFSGPAGADYTIVSGSVSYGTIAPGATGTAGSAYLLSVSSPAVRPALHWDAWFTETLDVPHVLPFRRLLHIGDSFADVPKSALFYPFIENVLHHRVTAGCGASDYCPDSSVTRAQMAVFLLKAKHGPNYMPPSCTGLFGDVACPSQFADWIEQLFHEGITGGCGGGNYCPSNPVTRAQMAAFLLKAEHGSSFVPPACNGMFADVTCPSLFADWIEQLAAEGITGGCGGGNYCPNNPNTRGQMAAFLVKTFGLQLYGP